MRIAEELSSHVPDVDRVAKVNRDNQISRHEQIYDFGHFAWAIAICEMRLRIRPLLFLFPQGSSPVMSIRW